MKKALANFFIIFLLFHKILFNVLPLPSYFNYWDEIIEIAFFGLSALYVIHNKAHHYKTKTGSSKFILSVIAIILIGLIGNLSFKHITAPEAIFSDIIVFLKFPLVYYILKTTDIGKKISDNISKHTYAIIKVAATTYLLFGVLNILMGLGLARNEVNDTELNAYTFLFAHPTDLVSSSILMLSLLNFEEQKIKKNIFFELCLLIVILLAGRTKGIAAIFAYLFVKYAPKALKNNKIISIAIMGVIILIASIGKLSLYSTWSSSQREQLYDGSFTLAQKYFPIGSGFSTYASHASDKYHSTAYYETNITFYVPTTGWGAVDLGDAGYAYYIGEFGFLGCILIIYIFAKLYKLTNDGIDDPIPAQILMLYIVIALTTETTLLNYGIEYAVILAIVSSGKQKEKNVLEAKEEV